MASPTPKSQKKPRKKYPFRLTGANSRLSILEILSNFGIATRDQLARFHFGVVKPTRKSQLRQIQQITKDLEGEAYIHYLKEKETAPIRLLPPGLRVYGLTAKGVKEVIEREMSGDPYALSPDKSLTNLEHDLKRTETHYAMEQLCDAVEWPLRWQKTDIYRHVDPDDVFIIRTTPFVLEEENRKKTFEDLYTKAKRHFDYWDTDRAFRDWGFRKPNILWQFPNTERMFNFLDYLTGKCNCTYYRGKIKHTCLKELKKPPITTKNFLFTTDELIWRDTEKDILVTAADYRKRTYSFSDFVS